MATMMERPPCAAPEPSSAMGRWSVSVSFAWAGSLFWVSGVGVMGVILARRKGAGPVSGRIRNQAADLGASLTLMLNAVSSSRGEDASAFNGREGQSQGGLVARERAYFGVCL